MKCRKYVYRYWLSSSFISKENHVFIEEENIPEKSVIVEEKLDGIRNVEDLPWLVLK